MENSDQRSIQIDDFIIRLKQIEHAIIDAKEQMDQMISGEQPNASLMMIHKHEKLIAVLIEKKLQVERAIKNRIELEDKSITLERKAQLKRFISQEPKDLLD